MALATGLCAEVQRPFATAVIGSGLNMRGRTTDLRIRDNAATCHRIRAGPDGKKIQPT